MSITFSISASIALGLLFFHKLYIILVHPEKNIRASYTTTKLIRCHFGNSAGASASEIKHQPSKTRVSSHSQSISIGLVKRCARTKKKVGAALIHAFCGSYPTRTASLHLMNQSSSTTASAATGVTMAAATAPCEYRNSTATDRPAYAHGQAAQHPLSSSATTTPLVAAPVLLGAGGGGSSNVSRAEIATQTEPPPSIAASRLARAFSVRSNSHSSGGTIRRKALDEDVMVLIDSCRRYQVRGDASARFATTGIRPSRLRLTTRCSSLTMFFVLCAFAILTFVKHSFFFCLVFSGFYTACSTKQKMQVDSYVHCFIRAVASLLFSALSKRLARVFSVKFVQTLHFRSIRPFVGAPNCHTCRMSRLQFSFAS